MRQLINIVLDYANPRINARNRSHSWIPIMPDSVYIHVFRSRESRASLPLRSSDILDSIMDLLSKLLRGGRDIDNCSETVWEQIEGRGNETIPRQILVV